MMLRKLIISLFGLCLALSSSAQNLSSLERNEQRSERGLTSYNNVFTSKGQWSFGGSASYTAHNNEDYNLIVVDDINSIGYNFDVSTMFAYTFTTNNSVGGRFSYSRTLLKIDSSDLVYGDEDDGGVNLSFDNCYMLTHNYSAMAIMRQYIPVGSSKRYALFNEVQLEGSGARSKFTYDSPVQGTYSTTKEIALNFAPGITAFVTNNFAVEINVGAMGLSFSRTDQVHNQVDEGSSKSNSFNFQINLLSIGFGLIYYL